MAKFHQPRADRPYVLIEAALGETIVELDRDAIVAAYKQHGALLLRGFEADVPNFRTFTTRFCATSVINESPGRDPVDMAGNIHSVDRGSGAFPLHPELSREPWKPDAAFFFCQSAPGNGGETTICDGIEIVRAMPADLRDALAARRLVYIQPVWPALLEFWLGSAQPSPDMLTNPPPSCPYQFRTIGGALTRIFSRPALHRPMFSDAPAFGNFLLFARFNNGRADFPVLDDGRPVPEPWLQAIKAIGDRLAVPIKWQGGDVLMLDNTRFMHGRTEILDTAERQIATYFGYLDFAVRDPEEPPAPPWRYADFCPPRPPALAAYRAQR